MCYFNDEEKYFEGNLYSFINGDYFIKEYLI